MEQLLNPGYWFDVQPGDANILFWRIIFIISGIVLGLAIWASFNVKKHRKDGLKTKLLTKLALWGYFVGPVFLVLAFFRFQNAYLLSMRLWYALWMLGSLVWLGFIIKYWKVDMPKRRAERKEREAFTKYLPSKK